MCGANPNKPTWQPSRCGSSPRVRGELHQRRPEHRLVRIIPACAGRTSARTGCPLRWPDHPRVCGANFSQSFWTLLATGSSPRVRGERLPMDTMRPGIRIIPACAGRTQTSAADMVSPPDHPRVCGANMVLGSYSKTTAGSSPRVRGEPGRTASRRPRGRIIPACAGRTVSGFQSWSAYQDHPRVCGANPKPNDWNANANGSSPRVRGEHHAHGPCSHKGRIIPACAGRTSGRCFPCLRRSDHPRVCGANAAGDGVEVSRGGSSPRVRGEPLALVTSNPATLDHPRVCGANSLILCRNDDCLFTEKFDSHSRSLSVPATQYSIFNAQLNTQYMMYPTYQQTHRQRPNLRYRDALLHPVFRAPFRRCCWLVFGRIINSNPS